MLRPRRSVAALCIAVTALAAFLPGVWSLDAAWFEPQWILLPADGPVVYCPPSPVACEQPRPLFSRLTTRGPPPVLFS